MTIPGFQFAVHILVPVLLPDLAMKTITVFNGPLGIPIWRLGVQPRPLLIIYSPSSPYSSINNTHSHVTPPEPPHWPIRCHCFLLNTG
jgi:hypothetical protein